MGGTRGRLRTLITGGTGFIGRRLTAAALARGAIVFVLTRHPESATARTPAQVVGSGDHSPFGVMARLFLRGRLPPIGWAPQGAFTFAHVDDVADGMLAAGERGKPGEVYFLAGERLTLRPLMRGWKTSEGRAPMWLWLPRPAGR